jgi:hypothetical protein
MKTTLNLLLLVLAIALPVVTLAGLVGLLPVTAFLGIEAAFFAFSFVGMMLIALNDDGRRRRPVIVRQSSPATLRTVIGKQAAYRTSYGLRRNVCTTV